MTIAQKEEYYDFCKRLDKGYIEQYICKPQYIWFREGYDCTYSCGEIVWQKGKIIQ